MSNFATSALLRPYETSALSLDEIRRASWLKSRYSDPVWFVTDTDDDSEATRISFEYRLADGRCLTETPRLYATVKEYAWFVRDPRFSKIDTAAAHSAAVKTQRTLAHALTLRGIPSYAHLQPGDIDELVQELRFGVDAVLHASERVAAYIERIEGDPHARGQPYKGFPVARTVKGYSKNIIDSGQLVAACNLPDSAKLLPPVAWLIAGAAERAGMKPRSRRDREEAVPARQNVTKQQLQRSLDTLDLLFAIRDHAQCEIPDFRPFPSGVMKVANRYGVDHKTTPVPPPKLVLHLLEASAKWVGQHSRPILGCLDELEALRPSATQEAETVIRRCQAALPPFVAQKLLRRAEPERFLVSAIEMLATASWVIVAAFGARRYEETINLNEDHLVGDDQDGWWLESFISKTTRKRELIPVPPIVARAVETLIAISATARAEGLDDLYWWLAPPAAEDRWSPREISPRKLLDEFASLVDTPLHDDGKGSAPWHWVPRQFRRFFAVLYFYRFEGADLAILSYFLRHFDIETTRGYVTRDPEAAKIWRDVEKDYVHRLANSIASGEREVSGAMGERLKKIAKLVTDGLEKRLIVAKDAAADRLQTIMERGGLVITPKRWVTCTCPRTHNAAKKARCRAGQPLTKEIVGPFFADAGPTVCRNCPWALLEPGKNDYACQAQSSLQASVDCGRGAGTLFRELEQAHLVELNQVVARQTNQKALPIQGATHD
jgi:integrase